MTLGEFNAAVEGYQRNVKLRFETDSVHTANLMNVWLPKNKRVSVAQLTGRKQKNFRTREALEAEMRRRKQLDGD